MKVKRKEHGKIIANTNLIAWHFDFILMANLPELMLFFIPYVVFLWGLKYRKISILMSDSRLRFRNKPKE